MGSELPIDPFWFSEGEALSARLGHHYDEYFPSEPSDSKLGLGLDELVEGLPQEEREVLELRVYGRFTFSAIARHQQWCSEGASGRSYPNKKRAWRVYQRALSVLKERIEEGDYLASV